MSIPSSASPSTSARLLHHDDDDLDASNINSSLSYYRECRSIIGLAWPVALSSACRVFMSLTDVAVLGRLSSRNNAEQGTQYIAAAAMAWVIIDVSSSFAWSSTDALNTLCSQAYGARNFPLVGRWLQTGLASSTIIAIVVMLSFLCTQTVLLQLGMDRDISRLAHSYALLSIPSVLPNLWYYAIRQYFQAQGIVEPALICNALFVGINLILNLVLVEQLGFIGSPVATSISKLLQFVAFYWYMFVYRRLHMETWPRDGWNWGAIFERKHITEFINQAVPITLSTCFQSWELQITTLFAARLGTVDVATQSSAFNLFCFLDCFAFGVQKAASVRVGTHLGASRPHAASIAARASAAMALFIGLSVGAFVYICRYELGHIYSTDQRVWRATAGIGPIIGCAYVMVAMSMCMTGILQGQARASPVAYIGGVSLWLVALPLAYTLAFTFHYNLNGLWIADSIGYAVFTILTITHVVRSDWVKLSIQAVERSSGSIEQPRNVQQYVGTYNTTTETVTSGLAMLE